MSLEDKMHLTSLMCSDAEARLTEGDRSRARRRRRKARGEEEGGAKKRRLSDEQVKFLEMNFGRERKLESGRKVYLATELGLDPKQVAVWFQNRRARWKSKQMEEEYLRLKSMHDAVVLEKCHLEAEVLKLKEQLADANKGMNQVFAAGSSDDLSCGERSSSSPSSSFSVEAQQPLLGELGVERGAELMFMHEYYYYDDSVSIVDWPDFYGM